MAKLFVLNKVYVKFKHLYNQVLPLVGDIAFSNFRYIRFTYFTDNVADPGVVWSPTVTPL